MFTQNLHTHTTFDDGQNTMEEMVRAAKDAGLTALGVSVHMPMPFRSCWTIQPEGLDGYIAEANRLKLAYRGSIDVFCGAEWDLYSSIEPAGFDYVIGSLHHIAIGNELPSVDNSIQETRRMLCAYYRWDADALAEAYFSQYLALAEVKEVDIVGHFDLLTKFDEQSAFFDAGSPRFQQAALTAMDALIAGGKIFEINTGAISRGYRKTPYPSRFLLREIHKRGGRITISSDAHRAEDIVFGFAEAAALARECGFSQFWQFDGTEFVSTRIGG